MPMRLLSIPLTRPEPEMLLRLRELESEMRIETESLPEGGHQILHFGWDQHLLGPSGGSPLLRLFCDQLRIDYCVSSRSWKCKLIYAAPKQIALHAVFSIMAATELSTPGLGGPRLLLIFLFLNLLPLVSGVLVLRSFGSRMARLSVS